MFSLVLAAADCVPCTSEHRLDVFYTSVLVVAGVRVCVCVCVCVLQVPNIACRRACRVILDVAEHR